MKLNKDFLIDVLDIDKSYFNNIESKNILMRISIDYSINEYKLTHILKDYIIKNKLFYEVGVCFNLNRYFCNIINLGYINIDHRNKLFYADCEFEAVYKAGLYVWESNNE